LKLIEGSDSFILESCFAQTVFETLNEPFSRPNEVRVYQFLLNRCTEALSALDHMSERDAALLAATQFSPPYDYASQSSAVALALLRTQVCSI
jgi:hypothetical protein